MLLGDPVVAEQSFRKLGLSARPFDTECTIVSSQADKPLKIAPFQGWNIPQALGGGFAFSASG
jgi:hypothetical protein